MKQHPESLRTVAVGPRNPDFGSWNWLGTGLSAALQQSLYVRIFDDPENPPDADCTVFLKFLPSAAKLRSMRSKSMLIYMPIDLYGSCGEIETDRDRLMACDLVLVHCTRLLRYFFNTSRTAYVDHPIKYVLPEPRATIENGPLLWIGRKCNIAPVVEWANLAPHRQELWILTDVENTANAARDFGFSRRNVVRVGRWDPQIHLDWLKVARVAVDIKGNDFRSRHKPPAKMLDFMASGIPVITNRGSAGWMHARCRELWTADASDLIDNGIVRHSDRIVRQAQKLRTELTEERVYSQYENLIREVFHDVMAADNVRSWN